MAPDFTLPLVSEEGEVSLLDYRGRTPVFVALLRSIWCPFCRRQVARLSGTREKLATVGVETLGIIEAPEPMNVDDAQAWLRKHDRFGEIPEDQAVMDQLPPRAFNVHAGHFLIDRQGIIRRDRDTRRRPHAMGCFPLGRRNPRGGPKCHLVICWTLRERATGHR
jgi:peroxiredoxin